MNPADQERQERERDILAELLWTPSHLDALASELPADAFWFEPHRAIYRRLLGYREAGREWSYRLLCGDLESNRPLYLAAVDLHSARIGGFESVGQMIELARQLCRVATNGRVRSHAQAILDDPEHADAHANAVLEASRNGTSPSGWERIAVRAPAFVNRSYAPPASLLNGGMIARGDLAVLYGKPGMGKSWLAISLAVAIARGEPWLGLTGPVNPSRAAFISLEIPAHRLQARISVLCGDAPPDTLWLVSRPDLKGAVNILDDDCYRQIERLCRILSLDLLVLDAMSRIHKADENDAELISEMLARCNALGHNGGPATLLVHHERKSQSGAKDDDGDLDALRGPSRLQSDPTCLMRLKRHGNLLKLVCSKSNNGPDFEDKWLALSEHGPPVTIEPPKEKAARHSGEVIEALKRRSGRASAEQLAADTGMTSRTVRRHLEAAGVQKIGSTRGAVYAILDNLDNEACPDQLPL